MVLFAENCGNGSYCSEICIDLHGCRSLKHRFYTYIYVLSIDSRGLYLDWKSVSIVSDRDR